jgi:hypothetical protein
MSYSDPQSVTFAAPLPVGAVSLPRTSSGLNGSTYSSADGLTKLTASSQYGKRTRRLLRLDYSKISADVFLPATNVQKGMSVYMVFDLPPVGFSNAEALAAYVGFKGAFTASSDALVSKLLGGES